jgi:hypothetical protein
MEIPRVASSPPPPPPPPQMMSAYNAGGGGMNRMPMQPLLHDRARAMRPSQPQVQQNKARRLYVGNIPYHVGISENGMVQLFSALFVAGFRQLSPGEQLPVTSFWLHSDGKFGFMELRGDQEAVDCMQFNGVVLHGRPLRVNRPSDYQAEAGLQLAPSQINAHSVVELCNQLTGLVAPPAHIVTASLVAGPPPPHQRTNGAAHQSPPPPMRQQVPASARMSTGGPAVQPMLRSQPPLPGAAGATAAAAAAAASPSAAGAGPDGAVPATTTVVSLEHIVTNEDLDGSKEEYDDLVMDVREECSNYGTLVDVCIPRSGPARGTAFIAYATLAEAEQAIAGLRERVFSGQAIKGVVVPNQTSAVEAAARYRRGS